MDNVQWTMIDSIIHYPSCIIHYPAQTYAYRLGTYLADA